MPEFVLPPAAAALLDDIDAWVVRTKSSSGQLGQMVLNHGGFVPLLRKRGTLKPETDTRLRAFMKAFPNRDALPPSLAAAFVNEARAGAAWDEKRHREMLVRLGYAGHASLDGDGEGQAPVAQAKPKVSAAVIRAAQVDGRDLPVFVTALIDMGLECWRDDRIAHGEPVA